MDRQFKAYIYGLITVLMWSTVASAFKLSLRYLAPAELLFYAASFSTLILAAVVLIQGKWHLIRHSSRRDWLAGLGFGLLNPFLYYLVLIKCYNLLPAQQAQPINMTWGITLSILAVPLLGHRLRKRDLAAILTSYLGVYIISTSGAIFSFSFADPLGVFLALVSTLIWSFYWIYNTRDRRDPVVGLLLNFLCSLPLAASYLLLTVGWRPLPWRGIAGALYVGWFEMGITFIFWLLAMKHTRSAAKIANLIFLAPFLSLCLIHLLVGEVILGSSVLGLLFIVSGLLLQSTGGKTVQ